MSKLAFLSTSFWCHCRGSKKFKNQYSEKRENLSMNLYKFMTLLPRYYMLIPSKGTKNLIRPKITCMLIRKNGFVNEFIKDLVWSQYCKCTGHTSNKSGPISPDIVPTEIEKNLKFNYPNYSSSTLFELPFH